jgi:hypothetical protein
MPLEYQPNLDVEHELVGEGEEDNRVFPIKCKPCMKFLNFCRFWQKGFKCEGVIEKSLLLERF